jgi:hypothetical protein
MPYTQHLLGYQRESTYGVSPITDASGTAYLLGITSQKINLPEPVASLQALPPGYDKPEIQGAFKSAFKVERSFGVGLQDAILIWVAMGKSVSSGASPPYTHTITCPSVVSGVLPELPSLTLHSEHLGTGVTSFVRQFTGMKITSMELSCSEGQRSLIADISWIGAKAQRKTFALTNKPVLIDSSLMGRMCYLWVNSTRKFNTVSLPQLTGWKLNIDNSIEAIRTLAVDALGNDISQWPAFMVDGPVKKYELDLDFLVQDFDMWDEVVSLTNNKTFEVKFTRAATPENSMQITATNCWFVEPDYPIPDPKGKDNFLGHIRAVPESVTFTVKDTIHASYYGE